MKRVSASRAQRLPRLGIDFIEMATSDLADLFPGPRADKVQVVEKIFIDRPNHFKLITIIH